MTSVQPEGGWQVVAYRFITLLIEHALGELAERVERMPDDRFLAEHQAHMTSRARRPSTWCRPC